MPPFNILYIPIISTITPAPFPVQSLQEYQGEPWSTVTITLEEDSEMDEDITLENSVLEYPY